MNLKTKAFGIVAGTALALSLATGAMAQSGTTVELKDAGVCSAALTGSSVDFGTYVWDQVDSYDLQGAAGNTTLTATVTDPRAKSTDCDVTFSAGNMTDGASTINVQYNHTGGTASNPHVLDEVVPGPHTVTASISSTLDTSFDPGDYNGTVIVSASNGS